VIGQAPIQDLTGDGNPATSDGIFVFANPTTYPAVAVGNLIGVTASVTEFNTGALPSAATPTPTLTELTFGRQRHADRQRLRDRTDPGHAAGDGRRRTRTLRRHVGHLERAFHRGAELLPGSLRAN
jgi:hypothetical protein